MNENFSKDWQVTVLIVNVIMAHVTGVIILLAASHLLEIADHNYLSPPQGTEFFDGRIKASYFFDAFDITIIVAFFPFAVRALVKIWRRTNE